MKKLKKFIEQYIKIEDNIPMPSLKYLERIEKLSSQDAYIWKLFLGLFEKYESWNQFDYEEMEKRVANYGEDELLFYFGVQYLEFELYEKSVEIWKKYLKIYPKDYDAHFNLGTSYHHLGAYEKMIASYEVMVKMKPRNYILHLKLAHVYRKLGNAVDAIKYYKQAIKLNKNNERESENYYWLIRIGHLSDNVKETEIYYRKAIKFDPKKYSAYFNLALNYQEQKRYAEAVKYYKKSVEFDPHGYYNLANGYKRLKKYKKAIEAYTKVLEFSPNHDKAYVNRGNTYGILEKYKKALKSYDKALDINPKRFQAYIGIFKVYGKRKEYLSSEIEDLFVKNFKDDKNIYLFYIVFRYILDIHYGKDVDLHVFEKEYKNVGMECCTFNRKDILQNTIKKDKKKIAELLDVLKEHTKIIRE